MTDIETGYRAFRGEIISNMLVVSSGFGVRRYWTGELEEKLRRAASR